MTSATYTIVANNPISQPQVTVSAPSNAAGAKTNYQVAFTTSATGALSQAAGSEILLTFPAGTNLTTYFTSSVRDGTGTNVGGCNNDVGQTITCFLFTGQTIDANENVTVTINGITNPGTAGPRTLTVSTTSDPTTVTSATYTIVANNPISQPQVTVSAPSNAAGAKTNYQVAFTTSATGALSQAAGSEILLTFPAGTNLTTYFTSSVRDGTGTNVGGCNNDVGQTITCFLFTGQTIDANENVTVTINGITNPGTAGPRTLTVSTTSDPTTVTSATYTIVANNPISQPQVTLSSPPPGAVSNYTITFATSATGALSQSAGSEITLTFPAGTNLTTYTGSSVRDGTNTNVGGCNNDVGQVITCFLFTGQTIDASETVAVTINDITNPGTAGLRTMTVSTSSDTTTVTSAPYEIGGTLPPPPPPPPHHRRRHHHRPPRRTPRSRPRLPGPSPRRRRRSRSRRASRARASSAASTRRRSRPAPRRSRPPRCPRPTHLRGPGHRCRGQRGSLAGERGVHRREHDRP